jgi:hypothetical protein
MRKVFLIASAVSLTAAAGCTTDDYMRIEGLTPDAGNAQAANTVLQMVDPWQPGVQHTNLKVPADRTAAAPVSSEEDAGSKDKSATADD